MTQDEIIEMAKPYEWLGAEGWTFNHYGQLKEFAKLVAAKERELCAQVAFSWNTAMTDIVAKEIRARGEA